MLKGKTVNLRSIRAKDLEPLLELTSDIAERGDYVPLNLYTETSNRVRFDKDGFWGEDSGMLLIVDREDDRILGTIAHFKGVHYYNGVEIGYILFRSEDRGKGIGSEALRLFAKYLFDLMPISRLQVQVQRENIASRRIAEKCGFQFEGTARHAIVSRGKPTDIDVFSLIRDDPLV